MNTKNLKILAVILVLLMGLSLVKGWLRPKSAGWQAGLSGFKLNVDTEQVDGLSIRLGSREVQLAKSDGAWEMKNFFDAPVDQHKVKSLLYILETMEPEFRSQDPVLLPDYRITDELGVHLSLLEGEQELARLVAGTKPSQTTRPLTFIRTGDSSDVYSVDQFLLLLLGLLPNPDSGEYELAEEFLLDKTLMSLKPEDITTLTIVTNTVKTAELVRGTVGGAPLWRTVKSYPFPVDQEKVMNYLQALTSAQIRTVAAADASTGLDAPAQEIRLRVTGGTEVVVLAGGQEEGGEGQYFKMPGAAYAVVVPMTTAVSFWKTDSEFLVSNSLGVSEQTLDELQVSGKGNISAPGISP